MKRTEKVVKKLIETYDDTDEFIQALKKLTILQHEKGDFFLEVGAILNRFSYFSFAISSLNYGLKYLINESNKVGELQCYRNLGVAYDSLGDFRKAEFYFEKSLEIAQEIGDKALESRCYGNLGVAYRDKGYIREAIEYCEKSLEIAKEIGDRTGESRSYGNLGVAYDNLGYSRKAIPYYEKSIDIARKIGYRIAESVGYGNLGAAYRNLGNFEKALEYHEKSLCIAKEIGDRPLKSSCLLNIGIIYENLGDSRKAISYYERSLEIAEEIGDRDRQSECYSSLGIAYHNLGDPEGAISYYKRSLEIAKEIGDRDSEAECYICLGNVSCDLGDPEGAISYFKRSLEIAKEIGDRIEEQESYSCLGNAYRDLGDIRRSVKHYEKSLEILRDTGDIDSERIVVLSLCQIYGESKPELSYDYCKRSIELSEMISGNLIEEEHKIGFYAKASDSYQYMVPLCLNLNKEEEAFEYTEKSKSRAFLDMLAATEIKPTYELTDKLKSLLDYEKACLEQLREIQTQYLGPAKTRVEPEKIEQIHENLAKIYGRIEEFDPEYVFVRRGKPFSFKRIQEILSSQNRNVVLIEYFTTKEKTFIFILPSRDRTLYIENVQLSREMLNRYVEKYRGKALYYPNFQDMDKYLIEPVSEYLDDDSLIYFVPYGPLHYLPLHILKLNNEPLIKTHPIVYFPSASLIEFCEKKGSGTLQSCASFGVVFEEESKDVAELFNAKAYNGHLATKDAVFKHYNSDIIHFACHGYFNDKDPLSSGVVLHDEILTAREILNMRLNTELVTLSGCQTGLSRVGLGDELIGLTRAILYAGAPSVIVSMWLVADRSTHELMIEFYTRLKKGKDKATALQEAQTEIMEKYSHPFYWAPFVLIGDWK